MHLSFVVGFGYFVFHMVTYAWTKLIWCINFIQKSHWGFLYLGTVSSTWWPFKIAKLHIEPGTQTGNVDNKTMLVWSGSPNMEAEHYIELSRRFLCLQLKFFSCFVHKIIISFDFGVMDTLHLAGKVWIWALRVIRTCCTPTQQLKSLRQVCLTSASGSIFGHTLCD